MQGIFATSAQTKAQLRKAAVSRPTIALRPAALSVAQSGREVKRLAEWSDVKPASKGKAPSRPLAPAPDSKSLYKVCKYFIRKNIVYEYIFAQNSKTIASI